MADPAFERVRLRAVLALPRPIVRVLAGGGVIYKGGRTLDPALQFLASEARPPPATVTPQEARLDMVQRLTPFAGRLPAGVRIEPLSVSGGAGEVAARAYRPADQDPRAPLMVFAHFGGGVVGNLDTCEAFCGLLAKVARCPVLSVDYRLAPEHRFPAALEDMLGAYRWAREHGDRFGAPVGRVAVGGDSMGGNFAAVICQELRRLGEPQPALQLLIYPALDVADESPSMTTYAEAYPLTRAGMEWFMGHYMRPEDSPGDPRLSPVRAEDLAGLAPAVVITAGFDPLLDQGETYARRLRGAGVKVAYRCYDHLAHAFTAYTGVVPAADLACREIARMTRDVFAEEGA